jgi:MFS transporter, PAT family, beta-lactamase induction signal transducer AmpG
MQKTTRNPWAWVPSLYLYEGIPYSIIQTTSLLMYTTMGVSVGTLAFWTSLLYIPWAIKPLWSPYVEVVSTKRNWIIITQLLLGIAFIAAGSVMPLGIFFPLSICIFAVAAVFSASHDIAADGFYMQALNQHNQAFFVGIRSTFYRVATLTATGFIPLVAGLVQERTGLDPITLNVHAVPYAQHKLVIDADRLVASKSNLPAIVVLSNDVTVPLVQKGVSEADSGLTYIALSAPPASDEKILLNITYKSGSKDVRLAKNQKSIYEFTKGNWNKPVKLVFQVNHNLVKPASAVYKITAGNIAFSWWFALGLLGLFLLMIGIYHRFILPYPKEVKLDEAVSLHVYAEVFVSFFRKPGIVAALLFFLFYRFGEAQSIKIATPFLVGSRDSGGIGLTSARYGFAYGTVGVLAIITGGILGGILASRYGLKKMIWIMALTMNLPNIGLLFISVTQPLPTDISVYMAIVLEQFGYGFGFTAYMLFMLYFVGDSKYTTAEYALCTSLMAFGMLLPGMVSGYVQEWLGYQHFFIYVLFCTIPGMLLIPFLKIDPAFGVKSR